MQNRCPSPEELSRSFDAGQSAGLAGHLAECPACEAEWQHLERIRLLAPRLAAEDPSDDTHQRRRAALLARIPSTGVAPAPDPRRTLLARSAAACVAAIAMVGLGFWLAHATQHRTQPLAETAIHRGTVHPLSEVQLARVGGQPDEIVRLRDGTITVAVDPLREGERFRVIVGDAEIEVVGTAFDVVAIDDVLHSVRVLHGSVLLRRAGQPVQELHEGDGWSFAAEAASRPDSERAAPGQETAAAGTVARSERRGVVASLASSGVQLAVSEATGVARAELQSRARPSPVTGRRAREAVDDEPNTPPGAAQPSASTGARVSRAGAQHDSAVERAFANAWRSFEAGDNAAAAAGFARVRELEPRHPLVSDSEFWLIIALERGGQRESATRAANQFLARHSSSARRGEAALLLGGWRAANSDWRGARSAWTIAASSDDANVAERARQALGAGPQ